MERHRRQVGQLSSWVVGSALALVGLSIAYALEDFANGVPARLGLTVIEGAVLLGGAYLIHVMLILLAAAEQRKGYLGNAIFGALWLIAALGDVLIGWSHRAGVLSIGLEIGVMLASVVLVVVSVAAWLATRSERRSEHRVVA